MARGFKNLNQFNYKNWEVLCCHYYFFNFGINLFNCLDALIYQPMLCKGASLVRFLITCKKLEIRLLVQSGTVNSYITHIMHL